MATILTVHWIFWLLKQESIQCWKWHILFFLVWNYHFSYCFLSFTHFPNKHWKFSLCFLACAVYSHSVMSHFFATVVCQAPLSMEFSRQEYGCRLPFPVPGDRPYPGIEPTSLASPALAGGFFTTAPPGKPPLFPARWQFSFPEDLSFMKSWQSKHII